MIYPLLQGLGMPQDIPHMDGFASYQRKHFLFCPGLLHLKQAGIRGPSKKSMEIKKQQLVLVVRGRVEYGL